MYLLAPGNYFLGTSQDFSSGHAMLILFSLGTLHERPLAGSRRTLLRVLAYSPMSAGGSRAQGTLPDWADGSSSVDGFRGNQVLEYC